MQHYISQKLLANLAKIGKLTQNPLEAIGVLCQNHLLMSAEQLKV